MNRMKQNTKKAYIFLLLIACFFLGTFAFPHSKKFEDDVTLRKRYDGVQVIRLYPGTKQQAQTIRSVENEYYPKVQLLKEGKLHSKRSSMDLMIDPETLQSIIDLIVYLQIPFNTLEQNLQAAIDVHMTGNDEASQPEIISEGQFEIDRYHTFEEINIWIREMALKMPELMSVIEIGQSYQGRPLNVVKLSSRNPLNTGEKPAMWLDSGVHANEWIGPATLLYFINQIMEQYNKDQVITELIDTFDWYLLPVFNADGYVYSWTEDRMWRKSRSVNINSTCVGVDLNRNWNYAWDDSRGHSGEPCRRTYAGQAPETEPEIRAVSGFLRGLGDRLKLYIAYHSFSQCWMMPYSHTRALPADYHAMLNMSKQAVEAIENVHGSKYHYGTVAELLGHATGSSVDYVYRKLGIKYAFGVELRDQGMFGSLLPPDQIIPNGEESFAGILRVLALIKAEYNL